MNGFIIRESALSDGQYYIDFNGAYEVEEISKKTRITENVIHHAYSNSEGEFNSDKRVYYFPKRGNAADAVAILNSHLKKSGISRSVELTEAEIEYIRRALINEDSNIIFTKNDVRTSIFNKLNS